MNDRHAINRVVDTLSVLIVLAAASLLATRLVVSHGQDRATERQFDGTTAPVPALDRLDQVQFWDLVVSGQEIGAKNAAVTILVFSDYACGFCRELTETLRVLQGRYPHHLSIVIKHFAENSFQPRFNVVLGAFCAENQHRFAEYHQAAFDLGSKIDYATGWHEIAATAGVPDLPTFEHCVRSRRFASEAKRDYDDGLAVGVSVTPTLFINGARVIGAAPITVLDSIVASNFLDRRVSSAK